MSIPIWTAIFKEAGLYNEDYHEKYRDYIHEKRYGEFINLVAKDIDNIILTIDKKQIRELMNKKFPEPELVCPDLPKGE